MQAGAASFPGVTTIDIAVTPQSAACGSLAVRNESPQLQSRTRPSELPLYVPGTSRFCVCQRLWHFHRQKFCDS